MAATGSRCFVRGRIGRAAQIALAIVVATERPRAIGRAAIEAIARAPRIAPRGAATLLGVAGIVPSRPTVAVTPRAVAEVAARR